MRISTKDKIGSIVMHRSNMRCNAVLYVAADCMDKYLIGKLKK